MDDCHGGHGIILVEIWVKSIDILIILLVYLWLRGIVLHILLSNKKTWVDLLYNKCFDRRFEV